MKYYNKGFTMIEIVVVISMILLASSILIGSVVGVMKRNDLEKQKNIKDSVAAASMVFISEQNGELNAPGCVVGANAPCCPANVTVLIQNKLISKRLVEGYTVKIPQAINECVDFSKYTDDDIKKNP